MALEIREYLGSNVSISESMSNLGAPLNIKEGYTQLDPMAKDSIMQDIEGIHVGPTRNFTWYTEQALDSSIPSWTKPYQRPLIMHHNETDGKIIGRVVHVEKVVKNTRSGTPALVFTCNVPDKEGIEQIKDGRLKTTSIGVIAHDVRCSICSKPIELDEDGDPVCGHMRGTVHNDKVCYWMIYSMEAKELSYVIVPSDIYAHNIRTYKPSNQDLGLTEKLNMNEGKVKDMTIGMKEGQEIDEEVKKGGTPNTDAEAEAKKLADEAEAKKIADEAEAKKVEDAKKADEAKKTADEEAAKKTAEDKLKEEIETLKAEKAEIAAKLETVTAELNASALKVEKISKDLTSEVALKEAAENNVISIKTELREATEENLIALRTVLNKPAMLKESLSDRSFESIKDSIVDLKEEMKGLSAVKNISEATDPTAKNIENNEKNKSVNVKESKTNGNIDLEEGLKNLMANFLM